MPNSPVFSSWDPDNLTKHTISIFHRPSSQISLFRRRRTIPPPSKNYLSLTPSSVDQPQPLRALSHG
ncbi:hypothetical protein P8452_43536 [Trifolium repens]|nr:hypothetical protein P8452_43536 [Trifolium repens]